MGSWNKIWHKSTKSGQVDPWTICMKMQIKRNLMNILEKWASAPDFLIQESFQFWFQLPTSITCNLQSIFSDFYGTWGWSSVGDLVVLAMIQSSFIFSTLFWLENVQKRTRNELQMPNVTDFIIGFSILKKTITFCPIPNLKFWPKPGNKLFEIVTKL